MSINRKFSLLFVFCFLLLTNFACSFLTPETPISGAEQTPSAIIDSTQTGSSTPAEKTETVQPAMPPALANESLRVVYTSRETLYLWERGQARQLTFAGDAFSPKISPDGSKIAFLRTADEFHLEIWMVNADGSGERRLVSVADMDKIGGSVRDPASIAINPYHFEWLPDSNILAFNSHQVFQGPGLELLNDLNLVNTSTIEVQNLFLSGWGGEFAFSPDGIQVVISQPDKIILSNSDGSNYRTVLAYDTVTTYSEYRYYAVPVWSAENDLLMVAIPPIDPLAGSDQLTELWQITTDGSPPTQSGSVAAVPFFEQPVQFSPDLQRIAFTREVGLPEQNRRELLLADSSGNGEWLAAQNGALSFQGWAPSGDRFAYSSGEYGESWIGSFSDSPQPLGGDFFNIQNLSWVTENQFLYWKQDEGAFEIRLSTSEGTSILLDTTFGEPPNFSFTMIN